MHALNKKKKKSETSEETTGVKTCQLFESSCKGQFMKNVLLNCSHCASTLYFPLLSMTTYYFSLRHWQIWICSYFLFPCFPVAEYKVNILIVRFLQCFTFPQTCLCKAPLDLHAKSHHEFKGSGASRDVVYKLVWLVCLSKCTRRHPIPNNTLIYSNNKLKQPNTMQNKNHRRVLHKMK